MTTAKWVEQDMRIQGKKKKDHLSSLDKENQYEGESFKSRQKS